MRDIYKSYQFENHWNNGRHGLKRFFALFSVLLRQIFKIKLVIILVVDRNLMPGFFFAGLSVAQRSFASSLQNFTFECIGSTQTDDELIICKSLTEFGRLIHTIEDERDRMVSTSDLILVGEKPKFMHATQSQPV